MFEKHHVYELIEIRNLFVRLCTQDEKASNLFVKKVLGGPNSTQESNFWKNKKTSERIDLRYLKLFSDRKTVWSTTSYQVYKNGKKKKRTPLRNSKNFFARFEKHGKFSKRFEMEHCQIKILRWTRCAHSFFLNPCIFGSI